MAVRHTWLFDKSTNQMIGLIGFYRENPMIDSLNNEPL